MKFSSVPAWSFGGRRAQRDRKIEDPGPGQYNLGKLSDFKSRRGYSLGKSQRDGGLISKNNQLGPGQYNVDYSSFQGNRGTSLKGRNKRTGQ